MGLVDVAKESAMAEDSTREHLLKASIYHVVFFGGEGRAVKEDCQCGTEVEAGEVLWIKCSIVASRETWTTTNIPEALI